MGFQKIIVLFLFTHCITDLPSQAMTLNLARFLNAAPSFDDPYEELELLPDVQRYYMTEELYNADTLTRTGTGYSFHNFGNDRYAIKSLMGFFFPVDEIIHFQKFNDTFALQTSTKLDRNRTSVDSTFIWWKDGLIYKALIVGDRGMRVNYSYLYDNGKLVHTIIDHTMHGKSDMKYHYENNQLLKVTSLSQRLGDREFDFIYSDSLIIMTSRELNDSFISIKSYSKFDASGKKLSTKTYMRTKKNPDLHLYQSEDYLYYPDGGYLMTVTQHDQDHVNIVEYHPGYISTEKWTWNKSDQVYIKKYFGK